MNQYETFRPFGGVCVLFYHYEGSHVFVDLIIAVTYDLNALNTVSDL